MKKILLSMLLTVVVLGCRKQTFDETVQAEVEQFNRKEAPKQLDPYTSFDSMRYERDTQTLSYFYTVTGDADSDLFPSDGIQQELLKNLRTSIQLKVHKEHGLRFHYRYLSRKTGLPRIDCTFTPEDYK